MVFNLRHLTPHGAFLHSRNKSITSNLAVATIRALKERSSRQETSQASLTVADRRRAPIATTELQREHPTVINGKPSYQSARLMRQS